MGEGEGGGGQNKDLLVPPPLRPLPPKGGEIFGESTIKCQKEILGLKHVGI